MKKRIKALRYIEVATRVDYAELCEGEVAEVEFGSEREFKAHLEGGAFIETKEPCTTTIPIFPPYKDYVHNIEQEEPKEVSEIEMIEPESEIVSEKWEETEKTYNFDELDEDDKQALLERENAKGRPYKCLNKECGRLRKKEKLFCRVCESV